MATIRRRGAPEARQEENLLPEAKEHSDSDDNQLGTSHWILVILYIVLLCFSSVTLHKRLPDPLPPNPEESQFSEIRARSILKELSNYGPKPAGSRACEELTRGRILKELRAIQARSEDSIDFEVETQNPEGCFDIPKFDTDGFSICYKNVSNVMAKLRRKSDESQAFILLNCHYDSWPTSSGGSDDLISCALMLELARLLAKNPDVLEHGVILLFNGAEESSLQAAHGFITKHPWRHGVRAFINLEASGSGGRELLFQAGPANEWLLDAYLAAAVHPHCSVIGQEVFQSGAYPGDTDFRVFRDFGRVPGLDLAFVQNGYWWHTEFDEEKRITSGSLQRAGENVYSTLKYLLKLKQLDVPSDLGDRRSVFFDFLGIFVVAYPLKWFHFKTIGLSLIAIVMLFKARQFLVALRLYASINIAMLATAYFMTKLAPWWLGYLSWYSRPWVAPVVYGIPVVWIGATTATFLVTKTPVAHRKELTSSLETIHFTAVTVILGMFTYYDLGSGYLFLNLVIPQLRRLLPKSEELGGFKLVFIQLFLSWPGLAMFVYTSEMMLSVFIPIMGRTSSNTEPLVAFFVGCSAFAIVVSLLPLYVKSRSVRRPEEATIAEYIRMLVGALMMICVILYIVKSFVNSPYHYTDKYPTTKRTQVYHTNRLFYNKDGSLRLNDTVVFAIAHDNRGAEDIPFVNAENGYMKVECIFPEDVYCQIPFYFPYRKRVEERHIRMKYAVDRPSIPRTDLMVKTDYSANKALLDFQLKGSGQVSAILTSQPGWTISNCSLWQEPKNERNDFLFFTCAGGDCIWHFHVEMSKENNSASSPSLLVGIGSHFLHGIHMQSLTLREILSTIETRRIEEDNWAITASAWNVDQLYRYV